jgi:hypothetical protein
MNLQIKLIALYNAEGKVRILPFKLGKVNIITGKSNTGKSTIIEIVDYCLGRSKFKVPVGIIQDTVKWYAVLLQVDDTEVFIAKPTPADNQISQSLAYYEVGTNLSPPPFSTLVPNTDDDAIKGYLSALTGISPNRNIPDEGQTRSALTATVRHATFYLFQKQNVIASQNVLFHRQSEDHIPQTIKDTLRYFLGAVREDFLKLNQELQTARRRLKRARRKLREAELVVSNKVIRGESLVAEAQQVGLISAEFSSEEVDDILEKLKGTLSWQPNTPSLKEEDRFEQLQEKLEQLRRELRKTHEQIIAAESFAKEASGYSREAEQQRMRLEAIQVFETDDEVDICPLCSSEMSQSTVPTITAIHESLRNLQDNLRVVDSEKPRLREYIQTLKDEKEELRERIAEKETIIRAILAEQEAAEEIRDSNARVARVVGRISLYLETFELVDEESPLRQEVEMAKEQVNHYEKLLNPGETEEILTSILNRIGVHMTKLAERLELEHQDNPYRLDLKKLTVVVDQNPPATLDRIGGGENWLGCHIITLLALHKHFIEQGRPVPGFLILDQPSQVYFPSRHSYEAMEGKTEAELREANADIIAIRRLFDLLFDFCEQLYPDFQIIVIEHANLGNKRFQESLVEGPWVGGRALIPEDWIHD